ncbi:MAG TPA: hypothetical protein VFR38_11885 [Gaiellaceae bacterium]|nr:hypothetical protein [Gaiellaceae bacterium]
MTEEFPGRGLMLMNERGKVTATLAVLTGLNGGVTMNLRGTRFAYVQSLDLAIPPVVPPRFRRWFRRLPDSTLEFGTVLESVPLPSGGNISIISRGGGVIAAKPFRPAWSPNGRRIAFAQARRGRVHLFVAPVDATSTPRQLTSSPGRDLNPSWSPDGRTIVFERHVAGEADLYAVRPNGTGIRKLTYWRGQEGWPDFSPDSGSVVFSGSVTGRFQLYVLDIGDYSPRALTSDFGNDRRPVWSPDGQWIAFSSDRDGDDDVFLISPDGDREWKLTHNGTQDLVQDWQPLSDTAPPIVRALPSRSPRGGAALLRYSVRDAGPRVLVGGDVRLQLSTPQGVSSFARGLESQIVRTGTGPLHVLRVSADDLSPASFDADPDADPLLRFRFCLSAVDPWGNTSRPSCAMFRFR